MHEHDERRDQMLDQWDASAKAWGRQADRTAELSQAVTSWMLDAAQLSAGNAVVELAAGPGDTGFQAAARVLPGGSLICSDASKQMLQVAEERAAEQGIGNVEFKQLQLEWIDLETAAVDVVLIKWALMLVLDPEAASRECRRVLKPGGRLVLSVWDTADANPWTVLPQQALRDCGHLQRAPDDAPGMFALADATKLTEMLQESGFFDVRIEPIDVTRSYTSITAWLGEVIDLSTASREAWNPLDDNERREVRERLAELAEEMTAGDGTITVAGGCLGAVAEA